VSLDLLQTSSTGKTEYSGATPPRQLTLASRSTGTISLVTTLQYPTVSDQSSFKPHISSADLHRPKRNSHVRRLRACSLMSWYRDTKLELSHLPVSCRYKRLCLPPRSFCIDITKAFALSRRQHEGSFLRRSGFGHHLRFRAAFSHRERSHYCSRRCCSMCHSRYTLG
jgi:hypothetical protein